MPLTLDATSTEWVSVSEVKAHANITSSASDDELELIRDAAQDAVEGLIGPVLWRNITETVTASANGVVALNTFPVVSLTTLTSAGSAVTSTLVGAGGLLTGITAYGDLTATYVAGRVEVPGAIRLATLIIAAHLWQTQRGGSRRPGAPEEPTPPGVGYAIPSRAQDLLAPYLRLPGVA